MKKRLKGMTLVECIVALAILAIFTTAMATAAGALSKFRVTSDYVIKQNSLQAPIADNRVGGHSTEQNVTVEVSLGTVDSKTATKTFNAKKYTLNHINTGEETSGNNIADGTNRNFKYYGGYTPAP